MNPLLARCVPLGRVPFAVYIGEKVLPGAFEARPDYTWRPQLVSDFEYTTTPPYTITYRIHPRASWNDGVPVSAQDFVFTYRANVALEGQLYDNTLVEQVRAVRVLDRKTVRVFLRSRFADWRALFGIVLPRHALIGEDLTRVWTDRVHNPKTGRPIGSGPFLVERWEQGRQVTLVRNPRYWGPRRAYLDRLVIRFRMSSFDPVDWFRSGEVDLAHHFVVTSVPAVEREPGIRVVREPPSALYEHFTFRTRGPGGHHPALENKLVRRAVAFGMDRAALLRGSSPNPNVPLNSVVFFPQSPYHRASWSIYRYDPARARRLLDEAGCRRGGDGIYSCANQRLSLRFVTSAGLPFRTAVLTLLQAQLRRIGVEVVPIYTPGGPLAIPAPSDRFDVAYSAWSFSSPILSRAKAIYGCGGEENISGYCQRLVTRDLDQANRILDADKRARVLNRADAQMAKDVPVIPFVQVSFTAALRQNIRGYVLSPFNPLWGAENWWLER
jgi:peptide/nickel transport system substrate-binding protein